MELGTRTKAVSSAARTTTTHFLHLIITGLVGLRSRADDVVEVNPLVPAGAWIIFAWTMFYITGGP